MTFTSTFAYYHHNVSNARRTQAIRATLENEHGFKEPAVAIMTGKYPRAVLPLSEAIRLAHEIADSAEQMEDYE